MIVSMMDDMTYVVGDKIYKVGDVIDLDKVPPIDIGGTGYPAAFVNSALLGTAEKIRRLRGTICNTLHASEDHYSNYLAEMAVDYENAQRDWLYNMDLLFKAIQAYIGAPVPLHRDTKSGKISIRKRDQNEAMNYTRDAVANLVRFSAYTPLRDMLMKVMTAEKLTIDSNMHLDTEMPCLSTTDGSFVNELLTCQGLAEFLATLVRNGISHLNFGLPVLLTWFIKGEPVHFFDARGAVPRGQPQNNELVALHAGTVRVSKALPKPHMIGVVMSAKIDKDKPGILIQTYSATESWHQEFKLVEPDGVELTAQGAGSHLHPNIETLFKNTLSKE